MEEGLLKNTGKSLDYWVTVVKKSGIEKHKAIIDFLKADHGFTYGYANFVAHKARKSDAGSHDAEDLVKAQYQGKENLKPIFDKLQQKIQALGDDVTETPKKAAVSFIRKYQFALVKPATKKRIDLGLKIKDKPTAGRLESSGPFGTMCTHRVQLTDVADVDEELMGWIQEAYNMSQ
jgi:predicted transport protein